MNIYAQIEISGNMKIFKWKISGFRIANTKV